MTKLASIFIPLVPLILLACASKPNQSVSSPASNSGGSPDIAQISSPGAAPCSQEMALDCPGGVDGCIKGQTSVHVCVSTTAQAGPSCSQEIALECSPGEQDACLMSPAPAANHICVRN
jgi:hypothetical protein